MKNKYKKTSEDNEDNNRNHKNENDEVRRSVYLRLKNQLKAIEQELRNQLGKIFPINNEIRSLGNEVGGAEVDYEEVAKKNNKDEDLWDLSDSESEIGAENNFNNSQNKSFIHKKKKRGKKGKMGAMILADDDLKLKTMGYVRKVKLLRKLGKQDKVDEKDMSR